MSTAQRIVAVVLLVIGMGAAVTGIGALYVVVQVNQASVDNGDILRVLLATSGCTTDDTPEACAQRQADRAAEQGTDRVAQVDCRMHAALRGLPPIPPKERCTP